jgi:hypothetical protein
LALALVLAGGAAGIVMSALKAGVRVPKVNAEARAVRQANLLFFII